ncbi:putative G-protein coupled receptor [Frankliniella fusca]|uniref:G-protein coupled receptor n=1 Tax=Frankliniella fusca TaxID=407009 RepID=A0AAE1H6D7_9NEOP|nr:putative G-protein coupled receptor [Frankliniella fusca]
MYFEPHVATCTLRLWLREIGFSLTYGALMLKTWRISVIFRVRSAKAVKITDLDLVKRVGGILGAFGVLLAVRTLVDPPPVIVGRTADDLKAFLCRTDWWDHCFTTLEVAFLAWGVRLCIVVRKAPSEFNESRFISMAIYNEFLLSVFLNVSMLFLQSPANPDLLFVIFFCHTQLTITLLLGLIFGSKAYLVFRDRGRLEEAPSMPKAPTTKFLRSTNSHYATQPTPASSNCHAQQNDVGVQEEFARLKSALDALRDRSVCRGDRILAARIGAMLECAGPGQHQLKEAEEDAAKAKEDAAKAREDAVKAKAAEVRHAAAKASAAAGRAAAGAVSPTAAAAQAGTSPAVSSGVSPGLSSMSTPCPGSVAGRVDVATSPERGLNSSEDEDGDDDEDEEDFDDEEEDEEDEGDADSRRPAPPLTLRELRAVRRSFKRAAAAAASSTASTASTGGGSSAGSPGGPCNGEPRHNHRHHHHHHHHHHHNHPHRKHHHRHKQVVQARSRSFEDSAVAARLPHAALPPSRCCEGVADEGGGAGAQGNHFRGPCRGHGRSASCPSSDSSLNGVLSAPLVLDLDDKNRFTEEVAV